MGELESVSGGLSQFQALYVDPFLFQFCFDFFGIFLQRLPGKDSFRTRPLSNLRLPFLPLLSPEPPSILGMLLQLFLLEWPPSRHALQAPVN